MDLAAIHIPLIMGLCIPCAEAEKRLKSAQRDAVDSIRKH